MSDYPNQEPVYFGSATIAGAKIELYRSSWKVLRTHFERWYAKLDVMSNDQLLDTRSESPQGAIGQAILNLRENNQLAQKIWG